MCRAFDRERGQPIIESNPALLLDALQRLHPADLSRWPYHIGDVLDPLAQATGVRTDRRRLQSGGQWAAALFSLPWKTTLLKAPEKVIAEVVIKISTAAARSN